MKNIITKTTVAFAMIITTMGFAQEKEDATDKPIRLGLGVRANTIPHMDFNPAFTTPPKLYINVDIMKYVRVDLQFGYYKNENDAVFLSNYKMTLTDKSFASAFGLCGVYNTDKTNFYGGFRFGAISYSNEDTYYAPNANTPTKIKNKGSVTTTNLLLGAEYFFSPRISLAGEIGYVAYKDKYKRGYDGVAVPPVSLNRRKGTEAALIVRFYLL